MTARVLLMDGEEGGVAVASRLRPELEGGDVEGTVRLTTGESSPSPVGTEEANPTREWHAQCHSGGVLCSPHHPHHRQPRGRVPTFLLAQPRLPNTFSIQPIELEGQAGRHHSHPEKQRGAQAHLQWRESLRPAPPSPPAGGGSTHQLPHQSSCRAMESPRPSWDVTTPG